MPRRMPARGTPGASGMVEGRTGMVSGNAPLILVPSLVKPRLRISLPTLRTTGSNEACWDFGRFDL